MSAVRSTWLRVCGLTIDAEGDFFGMGVLVGRGGGDVRFDVWACFVSLDWATSFVRGLHMCALFLLILWKLGGF